MDTIFAERPNFFEGQYLGADDLQTLLAYLREQSERHQIGPHTWGIVAGIDLVSQTAADGSTEYFLTPGLAVDGYGRPIAVLASYKIDPGLFTNQASGLVMIWIRHAEVSAGGVRPGFETCGSTDAYTRIDESFTVEVGQRNNLGQRQTGVATGDMTYTDARDALGQFLVNQPIAPDGSVAAQLFPNATDPSTWLIPVGVVPWIAGTPGSFDVPSDSSQKQSMIVRRQAGIVAESIIAANGWLRLRTRYIERVAGKSDDELCQALNLQEKDIIQCDGRMRPSEPIWLEEATRLTGDARLFGKRIEWQDATGTDYLNGGVPFAMRRRPDVNALKGFDLQVLLGQAVNGPNRFVVGQATVQNPPKDPCQLEFDFTGNFVIQDDGKVGVGTADTALAQPLTVRTDGSNGNAIALQATDGTVAWQINLGPSKSGLNFTQSDPTQTNFFIGNNGNVGIATATPDAKLDIRNVPAAAGNNLGAGKWVQAGDGGDGGRMWLQYGGQSAPLLVLSGSKNGARMQFQQVGGGGEYSPDSSSWIGHARGGSPDIAIIGGNVGIGVTTPARVLHTEATEIHSGGSAGGHSFADRNVGGFVEIPNNGERWVLYAVGGTARLWSKSDLIAVTPAGQLGVGTTAPAEALDVRGNIKLGSNGNYFGVGSLDNVRMLSGSVPAAVNATGLGWSSTHGFFQGTYRVDFTTAFASTPIVTATLVDSAGANLITVVGVSVNGFNVIVTVVDPTNVNGYSSQDCAFNFMAVGPRN
jgi:hypothetical protein